MRIRRAGALALGLTLFAATTTAVAPDPGRPVPQSEFHFLTPSAAPDLYPETPPPGESKVHPPIADFPTGPLQPHLAPRVAQPKPGLVVIRKPAGWHHDAEVSWYGPGFYGQHTACGQTLTKSLIGVAHRSLPCGTVVAFRWHGRVVRAPVVDRGPYVYGRQWDLTGALCRALDHCFTGPIDWRLG